MSIERIVSKAIDFTENNIFEDITYHDVAKEVYLSDYYFHKIFTNKTGTSYSKYLRHRRLSLSAEELVKNEKHIIDVAYDYRFNSPENYNRAFKKFFKKTPTQIRKIKQFNIYQKMNLSDNKYLGKFYEKMPFLRVKKFYGYGKTPEENAWLKTKDFIIKNKILNYKGIRLFGFNAPETNPFKKEEYGYVFLLYVPKLENCANFINFEISESLYLNFCVQFKSIYKSWKYFNKWKNYNKYIYGDSQWMEEHFLDKKNLSFKKYLKLYLPIK